MSYIGGGLTVDGYINANAPGPSSGIVVDGVEIGIPAPADWNATEADGDIFIKNKPSKLSQFYNDLVFDGGNNLSEFNNDLKEVPGDFKIPGDLIVGGSVVGVGGGGGTGGGVTTDPKNGFRLCDIPFVAGTPTIYANPFVPDGARQEPADWNATSGKTRILNKPPPADWAASTGASRILNKPVLSAVAYSNNYDDLNNRPPAPFIPQNPFGQRVVATAMGLQPTGRGCAAVGTNYSISHGLPPLKYGQVYVPVITVCQTYGIGFGTGDTGVGFLVSISKVTDQDIIFSGIQLTVAGIDGSHPAIQGQTHAANDLTFAWQCSILE